jgi:hypothetical protein
MALPVNFDPNAAIRIYNAVRKVEAGDRDQKPLTFPRVVESGRGRTFRMATFTGAWAVNSSKVVTLLGATSTTQTVTASNVFLDVPASDGPSNCAIANDRGTWFLLQVRHNSHDVFVGVSLQPTKLEFSRNRVQYVGGTASTVAISITECDNEAASAEQLNFFFG